jgi:ferric-chelate reductase (NADPH)
MAKMTERLADLASDAFLKSAKVTEVSQLSPGFVKVGLEAEAFRGARWIPGAKLQFRPKRGVLSLRTYTPIEWDGERGTTSLIAFTHGAGPAAGWFRQVAPGDPCEVFGPRGSIDLRDLSGRVVFVGDESSVGLACALATITKDVQHVFESADPAELTTVLTELGFAGRFTAAPRDSDRAPLLQLTRKSAAEATEPFDLVVTGDAATVHAFRRGTRQWPQQAKRTKTRAYWAEGRTGLD